jgi:hypothetical protein
LLIYETASLDVGSCHQLTHLAEWQHRVVFKRLADQFRRLAIRAGVAQRGFCGSEHTAVPVSTLLRTPMQFMHLRLAFLLWLMGVQHRMVAADDLFLF